MDEEAAARRNPCGSLFLWKKSAGGRIFFMFQEYGIAAPFPLRLKIFPPPGN
jgi:hypothetical protein